MNKYDLIYKGKTDFHHKKYHLSELMRGIEKICDIHNQMELVATRIFTGLKDKNDVDIYEGDILAIEFEKTNIAAVMFGEYDDGEQYNIFNHVGWYLSGGPYFQMTLCDAARNSEVIGNIYESPELLE